MPAVKRKRPVAASPSHKCGHCGKTGHHRTSCPTLAAALLKAAVQYTSPRKLEAHLAHEKPLRLNVQQKQQKSLKRSSGRRFSAQWARKDDTRPKASTTERKRQARLRELRRKPRATKRIGLSEKCKVKFSLNLRHNTSLVALLRNPSHNFSCEETSKPSAFCL